MLHLFGLDPDSFLQLASPLISRSGSAVTFDTHIGGWSVANSSDHSLLAECELLFYPKAIFVANPIEWAVAELAKRGKKITFAESCTGGLLSHLFVQVAGCSSVLDGSLVTYSNLIKSQWLGVTRETFERYGAVSEVCVKEMALGAIARTNSDIAISISGIAGPDGGTPSKPVGTVFVAIASKDGDLYAEELRLTGSRIEIQTAAAWHSVRILFEQFLLKF